MCKYILIDICNQIMYELTFKFYMVIRDNREWKCGLNTLQSFIIWCFYFTQEGFEFIIHVKQFLPFLSIDLHSLMMLIVQLCHCYRKNSNRHIYIVCLLQLFYDEPLRQQFYLSALPGQRVFPIFIHPSVHFLLMRYH